RPETERRVKVAGGGVAAGNAQVDAPGPVRGQGAEQRFQELPAEALAPDFVQQVDVQVRGKETGNVRRRRDRPPPDEVERTPLPVGEARRPDPGRPAPSQPRLPVAREPV